MPTVKTDDGRTLNFPDGMTKEEMADALSKLPPLEAATPPETVSKGEAAAIGANAGAHAVIGGEAGLGAIKGGLHTLYSLGKLAGVVKPNADFERFLEAQSGNEMVGKLGEQTLEFMGGEGIVKAGLKTAEKLPVIANVVENAPKILKFGGRAISRFATGYGVSAAQGATSESDPNSILPSERTTAGILNAGLPAVLEVVGGLTKMAGSRIMAQVIRPSNADVRDGYKVATIMKEGLSNTSLEAMHKSALDRAESIRQEIKTLTAGKNTQVDIAQNFADAEAELLGDPKSIGKIDGIKRVADRYLNDLEHFAPNGVVDVADAQGMKTAMGFAGEWNKTSAAADGAAEELFATRAYSKIREAIEQQLGAAGPKVKALNHRIQELIPVQRAIARRIPIEARGNGLGLIKALALASGHYGLLALDLLQRSTLGGAGLYKTGAAAQAAAPAIGAAAAAAAGQEHNDTQQ